MATPESLVYRGVEGSGAAQIFGREGNPLRAVMARRDDVERKKAIAAEQAKLAKQARDKKMWEMINVDPEATFQPFNKQVMEAADQHRKKITDYFENGGNPDDPSFQRFAKKGWDEVNDQARRSNYIKQVLTDTQEVIKKDPFLRQDYYLPKIWDLYMDENGNGKPLDEVDPVAIQNIYVDDPLGFNEQAYHKKFSEGLNDNMSNYINQKVAANGILTEDHETKWKGNVYIPDPQSPLGVKTDENGEPILNVTPELVNSYMHSDTAKRYFEALAEQQGKSVRDVVADRFRVQGGLEQNVKASYSRDPFWMQDFFNASRFGLKPSQIPAATNRAKKITATINGITSDGKITPEAQAAVGALKGSRYGDGHVLEVKLVPGNNTPGTTEVWEHGVVTNSPNPRLIMKVKYSDRGLPKAEEINLADEGAFETLNGLWETSPSEGKQTFSTDQLAGIMGIENLANVYKGQRGVAERNEAEKAAENTAVQEWQQGKNVETLTGRYYKGKKIVSARKIMSDPGVIGFGKKYAIEMELEGGGFADIPVDNYDEFAKIYRGEGAATESDDMVSVISPDGKKGKIPAKNLDAALKAGYKKAN